MGIVIGRDEADRRFVAHTPGDPETLAGLEATEQVGRTGQVRPAENGLNLFVPD
jgi:acetyl-CoA C-acetyltransferase